MDDRETSRQTAEPQGNTTPAVLLVEDEPLVRLIVKEVLEENGCFVVTATNGSEAVQVFDSGTAIVGLITDIRLGSGMTGWDVARYGRDCFPELPVIYITADSAYRASVEAVAQAALLMKPFTSDRLMAAVAEWGNV